MLADLRAETMATWVLPGGGPIGALTHVVIHGLDVTAANGCRSAPDAAAVVVLDVLTGGGVAAHFGVDASEFRLTATDLGWHHGDGAGPHGFGGRLISPRRAPATRHSAAARLTRLALPNSQFVD